MRNRLPEEVPGNMPSIDTVKKKHDALPGIETLEAFTSPIARQVSPAGRRS